MSPRRPALLIADDEPLARDLLRRYARAVPGLALVCECETADDVAAGPGARRPDVALLDIRMPGADILRRPVARRRGGPLRP
jgi:two-component system response regulator AlgR